MQLPQIFPVACHTDNVGPGTIFVVVKGQIADGSTYIPLALEKGASKIIVEHATVLPDAIVQQAYTHSVPIEYVANTRRALAELSAAALDYPARKLSLIAVTGTKGKTTSVFLLEHMFKTAGYRTALLSTVKNSIMGHEFSTMLTTRHPDYLHVFFAACVQADVTHVIMEVAAQAVTLYRTWGLTFDGILFTNFSQEHAEFYAHQEDYFQAKYLLFAQRAPHAPVLINSDDPKGHEIVQRHPDFSAYSLQDTNVPYYGNILNDIRQKVDLALQTEAETYRIICPVLLGMFNAYNILGTASLALALGINLSAMQKACATFQGVPGRMERYTLANGATCYIDYAHNPSSYENLLSLLRSLTPHLIVVFGAGGDRDRDKRPIMGRLAGQYADLVVLTSDNPRSEDPGAILDQVQAGMHDTPAQVVRILDRAQAITYACTNAQPSSSIAVLGKGSDEYQMIGKIKHFFSDRQVVLACCKAH